MSLHAKRRPFLLLSGLAFLLSFSAQGNAESFDKKLLDKLAGSAPHLNPEVLGAAYKATQCAVNNGVAMPDRLAVIDFSLPSSEERMWIFDLSQGSLVLRDLVAHGKNSGNVEASAFSNIEGSHQSSIGLFKGNESYSGTHGYALRLDGLEPGVNDLARQRAIVIHGADYVSPDWVADYGRIGRSHGCPAVDRKVIRSVVDNLKGGQLVFTYYPDQEWLQSSSFLNCDAPAQVAGASQAKGHNS
ncbi:murein L,D-transpeptidase catalytic domain family protein [Marinobacter sp.]|uniref:murein L,D-transpeptidase catalytic domain family protein n=1 Tax=Marinobacter sp. TaxID=50741 RepID=UPI002B27B91A|nr:murein L,D-transpeptidase catalytic domain family protein [Marinobacter sp.]